MLIKIDLRTLKRNPNAGNTVTHINHGSDVSLTYRFKEDVMETLDAKPMTYALESSAQQIDARGVLTGQFSYRLFNTDVNKVAQALAKRGVKPHDITINIHNNWQPVYHAPEPKWHFKYCNTKVKCKHCGEKSHHMAFDDDYWYDGEDERLVENICPKCGRAEAVDLRYEKIEEAHKRNGVRV